MRDEHVITRQGRQHVLFAGLLDEAHSKGLNMIETDLIQVPTEENGEVAIVKATVRMDGEVTGKFSGIGDASPDNVSRNIAPHLIRMAETRAKARALRDAINVGMVALEELTAQEEGDQPARQGRGQGQRQGRQRRQEASGGQGRGRGGSHVQEAPAPASEDSGGSQDEGKPKQGKAQAPENLKDGSASDADKIQLATLIGQAGRDADKFEEQYGLIKDLSDQFCRYWIGRLEHQIEAQG